MRRPIVYLVARAAWFSSMTPEEPKTWWGAEQVQKRAPLGRDGMLARGAGGSEVGEVVWWGIEEEAQGAHAVTVGAAVGAVA